MYTDRYRPYRHLSDYFKCDFFYVIKRLSSTTFFTALVSRKIRHFSTTGTRRLSTQTKPFFSILASPLIFLSPGFAVIQLKIFTLSVTISWFESRAKLATSSKRYHK